MNLMNRNVFIYWTGEKYSLINILHTLMKLHAISGQGYVLHNIDDNNIKEYIPELPDYFKTLLPAHQADFVRLYTVCEYGGIWLDSDTVVISSLDPLFDLIEKHHGFVTTEYSNCCNGVFGSKKHAPFMVEWKRRALNILNSKQNKINWTEIGNDIITDILKNPIFKQDIHVLKGNESIYPVLFNHAVEQFINKPYEHYKEIIRPFQPILILVNAVYRRLKDKSESEILKSQIPLNYFLQTAFNNVQFKDYDFIEIGTSNFDTLIEHANDTTVGLSIEPIKHYLEQLPNRAQVNKLNMAISDKNGSLDIYYIPEDIIKQHELPDYLKGCNRLNEYHPLHQPYKHLCVRDNVEVISITELFFREKIRQVQLLKIDTEGHDCIILQNLYSHLKNVPSEYYPRKIVFETNENVKPVVVDKTLELFYKLGYRLHHKGYDTTIVM